MQIKQQLLDCIDADRNKILQELWNTNKLYNKTREKKNTRPLFVSVLSFKNILRCSVQNLLPSAKEKHCIIKVV